MDDKELDRVRKAVQRRMRIVEPDPPYVARYGHTTESGALRRFARECLENAWSREDAEAVALAKSLGLLSALPATVAEMDLPTAGQLRYVWRNEPNSEGWHMLWWERWVDADRWATPAHETYSAVCGSKLWSHGQSQPPADVAICWRCERKLEKERLVALKAARIKLHADSLAHDQSRPGPGPEVRDG